jgi:hypothetical protein
MDKLLVSANDKEIRILKVSDIQLELGIGRDRAYALMRSAGFPSTRIGRTYFVTADNFEKWLNDYKYKTFILQE